ncbi:MAG TPA: hypothetical protein VFM18_16235 [Methanosarcina sp.]|nr:hypothetical protein [Methanosarcina sp.]
MRVVLLSEVEKALKEELKNVDTSKLLKRLRDKSLTLIVPEERDEDEGRGRRDRSSLGERGWTDKGID